MAYFQTTLIASALTLFLASSVAYANESCEVDLSAGFTINAHTIEFLEVEGDNDEIQRSLYKIVAGQKLFIDNKNVELSSAQKVLVKKYDEKIRHLVPQVKGIVIEGVDLAVDGVNLAFNGLLGEGNNVAIDLTAELTLIREQVLANLSIEEGISIGVDGLASEELLGEDFDERIEASIERAVLSSMGSILITMGQQMVTSDGDEPNFQTRMESFGEKMESEMEARAAVIEKKAEALCVSIAKVDSIEEQLKTQIKPLSTINVFTVTQVSDEDVHISAK